MLAWSVQGGTMKILGLLFSIAIAIVMPLTAGSALANHVQCGDVIAQDTTLDSDLLDCPADGIVIGADNITLDLNGHTIDGISTSPFHGARGVVGTTTESCPIGCSRGVTIENGSIQQFFLGIELNNLQVPMAAHSVIRQLTISGTGSAMEVAGDGMQIERNSMDSSMFVSDSVGVVIERNRLSTGGIGIGGGAHGRVVRNSVSGGTVGISVSDGSDHELVRNVVSGNRVGIRAINSAYRIRVERNFAYANTEDGIQVECCQSLIRSNVANGNGDDGIDVAFGSDEFGPNVAVGNLASHNGDFGIEALPGVIDGGHNRAFGNGNPLQCLTVVCRN
jgi:parallel beta-helix repeat protein